MGSHHGLSSRNPETNSIQLDLQLHSKDPKNLMKKFPEEEVIDFEANSAELPRKMLSQSSMEVGGSQVCRSWKIFEILKAPLENDIYRLFKAF